jgi:hypothetical protein
MVNGDRPDDGDDAAASLGQTRESWCAGAGGPVAARISGLHERPGLMRRVTTALILILR